MAKMNHYDLHPDVRSFKPSRPCPAPFSQSGLPRATQSLSVPAASQNSNQPREQARGFTPDHQSRPFNVSLQSLRHETPEPQVYTCNVADGKDSSFTNLHNLKRHRKSRHQVFKKDDHVYICCIQDKNECFIIQPRSDALTEHYKKFHALPKRDENTADRVATMEDTRTTAEANAGKRRRPDESQTSNNLSDTMVAHQGSPKRQKLSTRSGQPHSSGHGSYQSGPESELQVSRPTQEQETYQSTGLSKNLLLALASLPPGSSWNTYMDEWTKECEEKQLMCEEKQRMCEEKQRINKEKQRIMVLKSSTKLAQDMMHHTAAIASGLTKDQMLATILHLIALRNSL